MNKIDSILNKILIGLLVSVICIMLIIGSFFISPNVFALSEDVYTAPYFDTKPNRQELADDGILINNTYLGCYYATSPLSDTSVYIFTYTDVGSNPAICFCRDNSENTSLNLKGLYVPIANVSANPNGSTSAVNISTLDPDTNLYYGAFQGGVYDDTTSLFTDLASGLAAVRDFIDNPSSGDSPIDLGQKEFDIPPGYAFYILTNGGSAVLTTKFSVYNSFFTGTWTGANQRIGISQTRVPSSGYTFGSDTGSLIPWSKLSTADSNILGQTYYGQFIYTNCPDNGDYLVIYNPVYAYDDDVKSNENSTIHVVISNFVGANRFALRSSLTWNGNVDSVSPDDYSDFESTGTGDLVIGDDSSLVWYPASRDNSDVDSTNGSTAPAPSSPYNDINSVADNNTFLGNLVERIIGFLEAPVSHIKSLFNAGVAFFAQLTLLWSWLPPDVVAIISSALIVLLVIGVIKFLWK